MKETRFSYNPENNIFLLSDDFTAHSDTIARYNRDNKKKIPFDCFIRGIINNDILYLRLYYPHEDINIKKIDEIKESSLIDLIENEAVIIKHLKALKIKKPKKIVYNVDNVMLKGILANI